MKLNQSKRSSHWIIMFFTLFIGYEWLTSGLSKLFSHSFVSGFHHEITSSLKDSYGFYDPILKNIVLPNATFFGYFIEYSEIFIGIVFFILFLSSFGRVATWLLKLGMVASILAAFLSINIFLYSGDSYFVNPGNPFSEAVSLDLLLAVMELSLFGYFYKLNQSAVVAEETTERKSSTYNRAAER